MVSLLVVIISSSATRPSTPPWTSLLPSVSIPHISCRLRIFSVVNSTLFIAPFDATSTPVASQASSEKQEEVKDEKAEKEREVCTEALFESQLRLAIDVLTSKSCSEDGLEDATNLLLQLSKANAATRVAVLQLLLQGARQMGLVVCTHIRSLCSEARELCLVEEANREDDKDEDDQKTQKGVVKDR